MKVHFRFLIILLLLSGGSHGVAAERAELPDIVLGMSTALTGPTADLGQAMRLGVTAGFERVNRGGGIHGRRIRLIALDDGYEPARAAPNMRQLIEKDNVLAVIGNVGTPTAIVSIPIADERRTLLFAPVTGAGVARKTPPDRYVINYRASYAEETGAMIDALIDGGGLKPEDVAFFTQRDAYGDSGFGGGIAALKRHGLKNDGHVLHVRYERNTLSVENALATLLYAEHQPRAIIMVGAYAPCAKFIALATQVGVKAIFLNVSFVGSDSLAKGLKDVDADVIVTQVVPHPLGDDLTIVREYRDDLRAMDPAAKPSFGSLEGYAAARIFAIGLERIDGPPDREAIVASLEGLREFDIGLGEKLGYGPADHEACNHIWPTILKDGSFVPFAWKNLKDLLKKDAAP